MSGSPLSFRQNLKLAASRFIDALAPDDRVAVIGFNERTWILCALKLIAKSSLEVFEAVSSTDSVHPLVQGVHFELERCAYLARVRHLRQL
jgi:hypothetical protein